MRGFKIALFSLALTLAALPAFSAAKQGGYEAGGQLGAFFYGDKVDNMFGPSGNVLGYYTDQVAVGGRAELGLGNDTAFSLLGEVQYNFPQTGELIPYAGALLGPSFVDHGDGTDISMKLGGLVGVKSYMRDNMAVFGEFQMGFLAGDVSSTFFGVGVGCLFKL